MREKSKTCGNCIFWIKNKSEPTMGLCNYKNNANPKQGPIKPVNRGIANRGIAIRGLEWGQEIIVLFGKGFGCIHFKMK